jgi:predicted O-methyltransferase YrrM
MSLIKKIALMARIRVQQGPFRGMRYVPAAICSHLGPKFLGTYEMELKSAIESAIQKRPCMILDVGAAEGYYAIGLAKRLQEASVTAFELTPEGRDLLQRMAQLNQVGSRIAIHGCCTTDTLIECLGKRSIDFMIMDVEGAEIELLNAATVPLLNHTDLLVELHGADTAAILRTRFAATHEIRQIQSRKPSAHDVDKLFLRGLVALLRLCKRDYLHERSINQSWFYMTPIDTQPHGANA